METTANWQRFRLQVEPKHTASLVIEEARPIQTSYALTNITRDQVAMFVSQKSIDPTIREALQKIIAKKGAIESLETQQSARENETQKIFDDQQRLRENIKALKGTPEEKALLQRYTQQLNEQENRLATLEKEQAQLETQIDAAKEELDRMIQELSFDVKL